MLKIFWDKDNIGFIGDQVNSDMHFHCALQIFLSLDEPLQVEIENVKVSGKCIIANKNVRHKFSCDDKIRLSILIEPSSNFAKEVMKKIDGNYLVCDNGVELLQQKVAVLIDTDGKHQYIDFMEYFAEYLDFKRDSKVLDERIIELLEILQNCDCYDHTIENFAKSVCLSPSRLSHLFSAQIGVSLKSYIIFHQLEKAFSALLNGKNITDAAMLAGFDSPSHFAATVKRWMGMPVSASIKNSEFLKVFI